MSNVYHAPHGMHLMKRERCPHLIVIINLISTCLLIHVTVTAEMCEMLMRNENTSKNIFIQCM